MMRKIQVTLIMKWIFKKILTATLYFYKVKTVFFLFFIFVLSFNGFSVHASEECYNVWNFLEYKKKKERHIAGYFPGDVRDAMGQTLFHHSAANGDTGVISNMIGRGIDVHITDYFGNTALHLAAGNGRTETFYELIQKVTNVNAKNHLGYSVLHFASRGGYAELVQALIFFGADVRVRDNQGITSLHWAARNGHPEVVQLLILAGAEVNARDFKGLTPLHLASIKGHKRNAEILMSAGANIKVRVDQSFLRYILDALFDYTSPLALAKDFEMKKFLGSYL